MNKIDSGFERAKNGVSKTPQLVNQPIDEKSIDDTNDTDSENDQNYKVEILWLNVAVHTAAHIAGLYGFYRLFVISRTPYRTLFFTWICRVMASLGVTAGVHRLWTHRTYKAKLPLRIILMMMQSFAVQNNIYQWVRDHRVHHKYTDTNADPHNSTRGFFFCHMGWLMMKKHPDVIKRGRGIDMSDILEDPVVRFQLRYETLLNVVLSMIIPTLIPMYFWNEAFEVAFLLTFFRWVVSLHVTWLVNSAAHMWGYKPYDKSISSTENLSVSILAVGEGWHNYHHVYPWDYKAAELGNYRFNLTTAFIDICAYLGLAYDLKTASEEMINERIKKTGDVNFKNHSHRDEVRDWKDMDTIMQDKTEREFVTKSR